MSISYATFSSAGKVSQHIIPGAYSRIDSVQGAAGFVSVGNVVIMGQGYGLKPATLYQFDNRSDALNAVTSGALRDAVRLAFDPGNSYIPQKLFVMAVNTATQSSRNLTNSSHNMVSLTSDGYGAYTTQINAKLSSGTSNGKKLVITYKTSTETFDNIDQALMTIHYATGVCTLTVTNTSSTKTMVSSVGGLSADLTVYATIQDLVNYINTLTGFTATVGPGYATTSTTQIDQVSALDINGSTQTLHGIMYGIINTVNTNSALVTAADVSGTNGVSVPDNDASTVYLTGGTNGSYTSTEWTSALTALEAQDVQYIATPDSSSSVASAISTHCTSMSSTDSRKERQFFVGGSWGDSSSTAITNAQALNSYLGCYIFNGGTQYDDNGVITNYGASYVACMMAAMKSAAALNMPLTKKTVNLVSLENSLSTSTIENLLQNGVFPLSYNSNGTPAIVRQLTTYQSDNLLYNELSMVTEINFLQRDLRNYLDNLFVGNPSVRMAAGIIKSSVVNRLQTYVDTLGIITADSSGKTYWNLIVSLNGDIVVIDFDCNITPPQNFIFITSHVHIPV